MNILARLSLVWVFPFLFCSLTISIKAQAMPPFSKSLYIAYLSFPDSLNDQRVKDVQVTAGLLVSESSSNSLPTFHLIHPEVKILEYSDHHYFAKIEFVSRHKQEDLRALIHGEAPNLATDNTFSYAGIQATYTYTLEDNTVFSKTEILSERHITFQKKDEEDFPLNISSNSNSASPHLTVNFYKELDPSSLGKIDESFVDIVNYRARAEAPQMESPLTPKGLSSQEEKDPAHTPEVACGICLEPFESTQTPKSCTEGTHGYCSECASKYIDDQLQRNRVKIACPDPKCSLSFSDHLNPEQRTKLAQNLEKYQKLLHQQTHQARSLLTRRFWAGLAKTLCCGCFWPKLYDYGPDDYEVCPKCHSIAKLEQGGGCPRIYCGICKSNFVKGQQYNLAAYCCVSGAYFPCCPCLGGNQGAPAGPSFWCCLPY